MQIVMADEPKKSNLTGNLVDVAMVGGALGAGILAYDYLKKKTGTGPAPKPGGKLGLGLMTLQVTN